MKLGTLQMNKLSQIPTEGITVTKTYVTFDGYEFTNLDDAQLWQTWLNFQQYVKQIAVDHERCDVMHNVLKMYLELEKDAINE